MKSNDQIVDGIFDLEPDQSALESDTLDYMDTCQKLHDSGQRHTKAVVELDATARGKSTSDLCTCVRAVRFTHREYGLLMLEASRQLAKMAAKSIAISEKMAAIISTEGGGNVTAR